MSDSTLILKIFTEKIPVQTIDKMLNICDCSERTVRRKIKANNIICSYNKNSLFYTLPSLAKFNQYGIWHHSQASFSKWGNLFETVVHLIDQSENGFTSSELNAILKVRIYDALRILCNKNRIYKLEIRSKNVYFSARTEINQNQINTRKQYIQPVIIKLPESDTIIAILVEIILNRNITPIEISRKLKRKNIKTSPVAVETVIEHYQLKKK